MPTTVDAINPTDFKFSRKAELYGPHMSHHDRRMKLVFMMHTRLDKRAIGDHESHFQALHRHMQPSFVM
jgi:hypothetical protein